MLIDKKASVLSQLCMQTNTCHAEALETWGAQAAAMNGSTSTLRVPQGDSGSDINEKRRAYKMCVNL
ncbi:hypothetical protein [Mucilaginibacter koreensis]